MRFKKGDKVKLTNIAKWYGGTLKPNEKCIVTDAGSSPHGCDSVIWVRNTKGIIEAIYGSWASTLLIKNQQLLFDFME